MKSNNYSKKLKELIISMLKRIPVERPTTLEILEIANNEFEIWKKKKVINIDLIIDDIWHKLELLDFRKYVLNPLDLVVDKFFLTRDLKNNKITKFQFLIYISEWILSMYKYNFLPDDYKYEPSDNFTKDNFIKIYNNLKKYKIKVNSFKIENIFNENSNDICLFINEIITAELVKRNYIFKEPIFHEINLKNSNNNNEKDIIKEEISSKITTSYSFEESNEFSNIDNDKISINSEEIEKLDFICNFKKIKKDILISKEKLHKINQNIENDLKVIENKEQNLNNKIENKNELYKKNTLIIDLNKKIKEKLNILDIKKNKKSILKNKLNDLKNEINSHTSNYNDNNLNNLKNSLNNLKEEIKCLNKKILFINSIIFKKNLKNEEELSKSSIKSEDVLEIL